MKKVLLDTNVVLDFALKREPFYRDAQTIVGKVANGDIQGYITASTATDIFYILQRANGKVFARNTFSNLVIILDILPVYKEDVHAALHLEWDDFEDAIQAQIAVRNDMDAIITRNASDFQKIKKIKILTPKEFIKGNK
jgi:predicted nucleic acid-binding protein